MVKRDFRHEAWRWKRLAIGTWMMVAALVLAAGVTLFGMAATSPEENIALSRNEVVETPDGGRVWQGTFWNHSDSLYTELDAVILFLDSEGKPLGQARGGAERLEPGEVFHMVAPLPPEAVRMQMYQLRWTSYGHSAVVGPFRPWEFGYVMDEVCEDWQLKIGACTPAREATQ